MADKTYSCKFKFLANEGDIVLKTYSPDLKAHVGDVIEIDNGNFYYVSKINHLKSTYQLILSE